MEEIKIRAWNTEENRMLFRKLFDMNWYLTEKNDENGSHCWGAISGGQRRFLKIMRSTGIFDKNGKEIYFGDILDYEDVAFEEGVHYTAEVVSTMNNGAGVLIDDAISDIWEDNNVHNFEIIGNIYENKELLEIK